MIAIIIGIVTVGEKFKIATERIIWQFLDDDIKVKVFLIALFFNRHPNEKANVDWKKYIPKTDKNKEKNLISYVKFIVELPIDIKIIKKISIGLI